MTDSGSYRPAPSVQPQPTAPQATAPGQYGPVQPGYPPAPAAGGTSTLLGTMGLVLALLAVAAFAAMVLLGDGGRAISLLLPPPPHLSALSIGALSCAVLAVIFGAIGLAGAGARGRAGFAVGAGVLVIAVYFVFVIVTARAWSFDFAIESILLYGYFQS